MGSRVFEDRTLTVAERCRRWRDRQRGLLPAFVAKPKPGPPQLADDHPLLVGLSLVDDLGLPELDPPA